MAKKIPIPRVKTRKLSFGDKLWGGIAGLSTLIKHPNLYRSLSGGSELGARKLARLKAARIAKYGKWGARGASGLSGLLNPWTAVPFALGYGAKYAVGKAFDPYRDETGKIGTEGHARLTMEARAREQGIRKEDMDLESFLKAQQELELNRPTYAQLRSKYMDRGPKKEDLWHKGLFWRNRGPEDFSPDFNEGGIARLL